MRVTIVISCLTLALVCGACVDSVYLAHEQEVIQNEWAQFKIMHNKVYESVEEENQKFDNYLANRQQVVKHNHEYELGQQSYRQQLNRFADLDHTQFLATHTGLKLYRGVSRSMSRLEYDREVNVSSLPASVDWRDKGAVTPIQYQGDCLSGWAFAAAGSLEGVQAIKNGNKLVALSEQQLLDCADLNHGCNGGNMINAYEYVIQHRGIGSASSYPYTAVSSTCRDNTTSIVATQTRYVEIPSGDETALMEAIANVGPVSIAIYVDQAFQMYKSGVYNDPMCLSTREDLNHAVLVVGYGTDAKEGDYWIIKNSWDTFWGDQGYMKIARNKDNLCGVATAASYPVV